MSQTLKPGTHDCIVIPPSNGWFCESSQGTPGLRIPLEITDGPCEGAPCEYIAWLSHAALKGSMQTLAKALDFDGNLAALANLLDTGPMVGKSCQIVCAEEEYNGKVSVKIKFLNPKGGATLAKDAITALVTKLNAQAMAFAAEPRDDAPKPKVKTPDPDPDLVLSDSEIPF